jgi:hypothetical protein
MSIEAMKQALEALEELKEHIYKHRRLEAIIALRQAIEQAEKPVQKKRPVCWDGDDECPNRQACCDAEECLYTNPQPQREWVGLTDEEMCELEKQFEAERVRTSDEEYLVIYPSAYWQWQRAIEAKLKEKNT